MIEEDEEIFFNNYSQKELAGQQNKSFTFPS